MTLAAALAGMGAVIEDPLVTSVRSTLRKDAEVTKQIRIALLQDAGVSRFDIDVITLTGRTSLVGVVDHRHQADRAIKLASAVDGVLAVRDELGVKPD